MCLLHKEEDCSSGVNLPGFRCAIAPKSMVKIYCAVQMEVLHQDTVESLSEEEELMKMGVVAFCLEIYQECLEAQFKGGTREGGKSLIEAKYGLMMALYLRTSTSA